MTDSYDTQSKIIYAALACFFRAGIKKTAMDDVAEQAGVTRMTLYRYFKNKESLVRAAFLHIVGVLETVRWQIQEDQSQNVSGYIDEIEQGLAELPKGDLPTRLAELKRVYPTIFVEFHDRRITAVTQIFNRLFEVAQEQGILRPGLNQEIVQIYFFETVIKLVDNPQLISRNLSSAEIFATVKSIFLYGILREPNS